MRACFTMLDHLKVAQAIPTICIYPHLTEKLAFCCQGKPLCLIIDEASDNSLNSLLGLILRFVDFDSNPPEIVEAFYHLLILEKKDASTITSTIVDTFNKDNLDLQTIGSLALDRCNTMMGQHNSVAAKLKALIPHLVVLPCTCHGLAKGAEHATAMLPCFLEFMVCKTYSHFSRSCTRKKEYQALHKNLTGSHEYIYHFVSKFIFNINSYFSKAK